MSRNHKLSGSVISVPLGIVIGVVISLLVASLLAFVTAYLMGREVLSLDRAELGALVIVVISSMVGTMSAVTLTKKKRLLVRGLTALFYYLVLLSVTAVFFEGVYNKMGLTALMILLGAGGMTLFDLRRKTGKSKIKIPTYR